MKLRQIAAAIMLFYAVASFAAESPLEQSEENSDALVSDEIESAEASDIGAVTAYLHRFYKAAKHELQKSSAGN